MTNTLKNETKIRIGVDIGGTFTDVVLEKNKEVFSSKVLTTSDFPEIAILNGIAEVTKEAKVKPETISQIIHGTTLATNALIERTGAKTALITTKGFRDVIEMRTESRFEQYDLNLMMPLPLISREHRYVIEERISATGDILIPINKTKVMELIKALKNENYASIAVGLIHSYTNDYHERYIKNILSKQLRNAMVSISSEVSPQMREYERFNTVSANAYVKPLMKSYLMRLQKKLIKQKIVCPIFLMHSGGGIISLESAAEFPVRLIESGPAGGAVFAATIAKKHKIKNTLSFDMGGTTAKICLIKNQKPKTSRVFEVARSYRFKKGSGMPISIPVIDMVEIGAGGGSLAHVDELQQIRVGPQSAGSNPGPACYSLGGNSPTVTDADLFLGKLSEDGFAGGSMPLSKIDSENTLKINISDKLGTSDEISAHGILEVVDENMANAARVHAVENGEDLSDYTMIAFGGAAPLHASRICEKLGINKFLVPEGAGVGSALGFLHAPFSFEATRSFYSRISNFNLKLTKNIFAELQNDATTFVKSCAPNSPIQSEYKVYMRYKGQGWEIPVHLKEKDALKPTGKELKKLFEREYKKIFGRIVNDIDIEITIWSVNSFTPLKKITEIEPIEAKKIARIKEKRSMFDSKLGREVRAKVIARNQLNEGDEIYGPAIITETETTIILTSNFKATVQMDKCISVQKNE
ncbi:MAG: hydantoinase/oxoprolinase family protein [Paracoccaceae bacterium]|nr:hydantoinase/oxoprolinase family protein [Paracoccaceae bacterium]